jgi:hypothetical protein
VNYRVTVNLPGTPEGAEIDVHGLGRIKNGESRILSGVDWDMFSLLNRPAIWDDKLKRDVLETEDQLLVRFSDPDQTVHIEPTEEEPAPVDSGEEETRAQAHERQIITEHEAGQGTRDASQAGGTGKPEKPKGMPSSPSVRGER